MTYKLPLFPLNTVLFPGVPITLHISEERYGLMIGRCLEQSGPFGEVDGPAVVAVRAGGAERQKIFAGSHGPDWVAYLTTPPHHRF